ncbi:RHS repeat-associated core domain-containing protein [Sulfurifustis variabilis]|uniref:RHS repeat-associated core domain-containing protein n=1 Tax=Sulfurifustis variabilis TaxID=1675686 RepID=UPI001475B4C3|nr:RHS repeat-associated core domain-containing protein [Sulfurifustis variabilis]
MRLAQDASGYTLTHLDGSSERYGIDGALQTEADSAGRTTTYTVDAQGRLIVTGPFGHTLTLAYDAAGRVDTITDSAGHVIDYTYTAAGTGHNLTRVDYPDDTAKLYHYEDPNFPHHLTGISYVEANGVVTRYGTYSYDTTGKAYSTEHAGGQERFTLVYDSDTQTTVTDAASTREVMTFEANLGVKNLVNKVNQGDGKSLVQRFDANNNQTCKKDEEGRVTTYIYNATNQRTSMTEGLTGGCPTGTATPETRTTTYQYLSPDLDLLTLVESPSVASGQVKRITLAYEDTRFPLLPTAITQSGYKPDGTPVSRRVGLAYNDDGQLWTIDGPRTDVADVTTFAYYDCTTGAACGQLSSVTNALGQVTTYDLYDGNGRVTQLTDPRGIRTEYEYDLRGRVTKIKETNGSGVSRTTEYSYYASGKVKTYKDPDGVTLTYVYYDSQDLYSVTDNLGNQIRYAYDTRGNRRQAYTYDPQGALKQTLDTDYDLRNRVETLTHGGSITRQVHDAIGNLVSETDPNLNPATVHHYDALNRLYETIDRMAKVTTYGYDVNDRLTRVTAPKSASETVTTQYVYDDLGNLLQEISPDRGTMTYTHDEAGNVLTQTNALSQVTTYTYDALNRPLTQTSSATNTPAYSYAYDTCGAGLLCQIMRNGGFHLYFGYDAWFRQDYELAVTGLYSFASYSLGGRLNQLRYPSGRRVDYTYDAAGQVTEVSTTLNGQTTALASGIAYYPFGPVASLTLGNGLAQSYELDLAYRSTYDHADPYAKDIERDANGNVTFLIDPDTTRQEFGYDALDRLAAATDTAGTYAALGYTYDDNGNRLTETRAGDTTDYGYGTNTNRLTSVGGQSRVVNAVGNTVYIPGTGLLAYDGYGRLLSAQGQGATYFYDPFNRRLRKNVNGAITSFHYLPGGELLIESSGGTSREYVYLNGAPLARIDGEFVYYFHTDHFGTVRAMTDAAGNTIWAQAGEPFGAATAIGVVDNNLRFPGQYYDQETGLHYNWNRYYDPKTGRYVTSDPVGLTGGLNTYLYVKANPLRWIDPLGLDITGDWEPEGSVGRPSIPYGLPGSAGSICGSGFKFPEFGFRDACQKHDDCYGTCGTNKTWCDFQFQWNARQSCPVGDWRCLLLAEAYFEGVLHGGGGAYAQAQEEACTECKK